MLLSVGVISYAVHSKPVLVHYFKKHSIEYHFIEEIPKGIDYKRSHPSWWKLLAHTILPGYDYIICWDLDLLPANPDVEIIKHFDFTKPTFAWDTGIKLNPALRDSRKMPFLKHFKYNGGLIGIPKTYQSFFEGIFKDYAPGTLPSWEQYYLNNGLHDNNIPVHELPDDINVLCGLDGFDSARLQHYTYAPDAKKKIVDHYKKYMSLL